MGKSFHVKPLGEGVVRMPGEAGRLENTKSSPHWGRSLTQCHRPLVWDALYTSGRLHSTSSFRACPASCLLCVLHSSFLLREVLECLCVWTEAHTETPQRPDDFLCHLLPPPRPWAWSDQCCSGFQCWFSSDRSGQAGPCMQIDVPDAFLQGRPAARPQGPFRAGHIPQLWSFKRDLEYSGFLRLCFRAVRA